jgi:hypothetical protein
MDWLEYFRRNRAERIAIPWGRGVTIAPDLRALLIRSLRRFQLGEDGEGIHLKKEARKTGDERYVETIGLFVDEEIEHATILGRAIEEMGGELLRSHWSDYCFLYLRRMMGLRTEVMVLMIAEMICKRYYGALYDGTDDPLLRSVLSQILYDEKGHIAFHSEFLRSSSSAMPVMLRRLAHAMWRVLYSGSCAAVLFDHHRLLTAVGVPPRAFWRDCHEIFDQVVREIFVFTPGQSARSVQPAG